MTANCCPTDTDLVFRYLGKAVKEVVDGRNPGSLRPSDALKADLRAIAGWITSDRRPNLVLSSSYGKGKTTAVKAIRSVMGLCSNHLRILTAQEIMEQCSTPNGLEAKQYYSEMPFLAIDDLGFEPTVCKFYGNGSTPVVDILEKRYELNLPTIITTNLGWKKLPDKSEINEIEERYGTHLFQRLLENSCFLKFSQPNYRTAEKPTQQPSQEAPQSTTPSTTETPSERPQNAK